MTWPLPSPGSSRTGTGRRWRPSPGLATASASGRSGCSPPPGERAASRAALSACWHSLSWCRMANSDFIMWCSPVISAVPEVSLDFLFAQIADNRRGEGAPAQTLKTLLQASCRHQHCTVKWKGKSEDEDWMWLLLSAQESRIINKPITFLQMTILIKLTFSAVHKTCIIDCDRSWQHTMDAQRHE